jgi:hypothetical protein
VVGLQAATSKANRMSVYRGFFIGYLLRVPRRNDTAFVPVGRSSSSHSNFPVN